MDNGKEAAGAGAAAAGLRGVVAASSSIGDVDGEKGVLIYQGIDIHDLARSSTFEEVIYLLWHGRLPTRPELDELRSAISKSFTPAPEVIDELRRFPSDADPMDILRTAVSLLDFYDKDAHDTSREASLRTATRLVASTPTSSASVC